MKSFTKFSHICNNFSQQKYLDSPVFNNVSRLNHSSRMNNTLQTKIKPFPENFLKVQKHPRNENDTTFFLDQLLSSNYISTYISKKMLIFARDYHNLPVVHCKYLIEFLGWNKLYFNLKFVVISLYSHLSSCAHLRELSRYKNEKQFSSVTLNWLKSTKTKWRFLVGITMFLGNKTNNGISLSLKHTCPLHVEDWRVRMSFFYCTANKRVQNSSTLDMAIKSYILELIDLVTVFKQAYL